MLFLGALVAFQLLVAQLGWAAIVNRTIDDTFGDSETRQLPLFLPSNGEVWKGPSCIGCAIKPPITQAFKGTYQAATYAPDTGKVSVTLTFDGTAVWVYFILANNEGDGITTVTDVNFAMDGESPVNFRHAPDLTTRTPLFNQLVYSRTDMPFKTHELEIYADANFNVYINFDYAIYTHNDDPGATTSATSTPAPTGPPGGGGTPTTRTTTSSTTTNTNTPGTPGSDGSEADSGSSRSSGAPVGAIAGGVVGGVLAIAAIIFLLLLCRRRRRKAQNVPPALMMEIDNAPNRYHVQENAFHSSGNGPLYSPVRSQYPNSTTTGSYYSTPTAGNQYYGGGGVAGRPEYDSDRGTTTNGSGSGQASTMYTQGSTGAVVSEKRRRQQDQPVILSPVEGPPGANLNPQQDRVRQARQAEIGARLQTVEQEMNDLKRGRSTRRQRVIQNNNAQDDEIADMREEMRRMQEEIMLLRSNQTSEWAQGLTDEPPPGYSPRALHPQPS